MFTNHIIAVFSDSLIKMYKVYLKLKLFTGILNHRELCTKVY